MSSCTYFNLIFGQRLIWRVVQVDVKPRRKSLKPYKIANHFEKSESPRKH